MGYSESPSRPTAVAADPAGFYLHGGILAATLGVLLLAALLQVREEIYVVVPWLNRPLPELCSFNRLFGIGCPGCGLTRCFISLAHGDLAAAWHYHPVGIAVFAAVAVQIPYRSWQLRRLLAGRPELEWRSGPWWLGALAGMMFVQWGLRIAGWC